MTDDAPSLKLDGVDTRYNHWQELLDLWQVGLEILQRYQSSWDVDSKRKAQLEAGIAILQTQLDTATGYSRHVWELRDEINSISKIPESIKGGRGTPLRKEFNAGKKEQQQQELSGERRVDSTEETQ